MDHIFSDRIADVPRSFIREILKVALDPNVISFAGGLPNRTLFPADAIQNATQNVFKIHGNDLFQYSSSEGFPKLREYISNNYKIKQNLNIPVENILITNGSQQGLDLISKIVLNEGDGLILEEPGYLGAIQAFSIYRPNFIPITVSDKGINIEKLESELINKDAKLMYTVPNFQNPSGITYSNQNRVDVANILKKSNILLIEDDPYGELRFRGEHKQSFKHLLPEQTIMLGSFSKVIIPGFRIGWVVAPDNIMKKLLIAKQAADLHTSHFTQSIIYQYLIENDVNDHIKTIINSYGKQCQSMIESIDKYFPKNVTHTTPEGGMFLWAELPKNISSMKLFDLAIQDQVVFVPGDPFYIGKSDTNSMRLNFSCTDEETTKEGIKRLGSAIKKLLDS